MIFHFQYVSVMISNLYDLQLHLPVFLISRISLADPLVNPCVSVRPSWAGLVHSRMGFPHRSAEPIVFTGPSCVLKDGPEDSISVSIHTEGLCFASLLMLAANVLGSN
jgi:hypothetical protein